MLLLSLFPAFALLSSVAGDLIDSFPQCWQQCIDNSNLNCGSDVPCICKASEGSFLTDTVSCVRSSCDSSDWDVNLFLAPLELACDVVGQHIPDSVISSAQCAATETSQPSSKSSATQESKSHDSQAAQTTDYITKTYTTTVTQTTTNSAGTTIYIIVPIIVDPSTVIYGKTSTLTDKGIAASTIVPDSTILVSTIPSSGASGASSVAAVTSAAKQASGTQSSTSSSKKASQTNNSNGSPFTNPQAAANTQSRSWLLAAVGLFVALF
jgi:hypothetical protein